MLEEYKKVWFEAWKVAMREEEEVEESIVIADACLKAYRERFESKRVAPNLPPKNMKEQVIKT